MLKVLIMTFPILVFLFIPRVCLRMMLPMPLIMIMIMVMNIPTNCLALSLLLILLLLTMLPMEDFTHRSKLKRWLLTLKSAS